jgi:hypothetical protein
MDQGLSASNSQTDRMRRAGQTRESLSVNVYALAPHVGCTDVGVSSSTSLPSHTGGRKRKRPVWGTGRNSLIQ